MASKDPKWLREAEEAALDHGSVDRIVGRRTAARPALRETVQEALTPQEEEAALDQGAVEKIAGPRRPAPLEP